MTYTPFKGFHKIDLEYLYNNQIEIVDDPKDAMVIVSQKFKQLKTFFYNYRLSKKYLIWTLEPRYNTHTSSFKSFFLGLMKVHVMNVYTGDVFVNPLSFHVENIDKKLIPLSDDFNFLNKKLIGLMSYYKGLETERVTFQGEDVDLIKLRTAIALYGHEHDVMNVYGRGWPSGISKEDSRDGDWGVSKSRILDGHHFNIAFENTAVRRYTTEKIWDSIANYCLPVYYGAGTDIYNLFPKNSFLDYSVMSSPKDLFETIESMSKEEYLVRMNKCIDVYNKISNLNEDEKHKFRQESLSAIVSRLKLITE